ncbi:NAD(P)-dependent oxidoreductase [Microbacterium sp. UCD-TDU]|uniref:NAD(P)-dependent oxidoreductase n=1 Tax=Microbacterium sp. UCD-TDU TaxID=1247714 RepID=UPI00034AEF00|nr:NAD(P)-dependent oxidoreductase [Microbacterium sp. UCD-TDU]EYT57171.1 tartronate semialdehyde reductase [Microbacterium sp. UCD-TDU]
MIITWVGFGAMGLPMASRLAAAGHTVFGRASTPQKTRTLEDAGVSVTDDLQRCVAESDLVVSMVPGPQEVRDLWTGAEGLLAHMKAGAVAVDMSTVGADAARDLHAAGADHGVPVLDCPVSGGVNGAANGALTIFTGGDPDAVAAAAPVLETLGTIVACGAPGAGQQAKLVNQVVVAANTYGLCLAYALTERSGIDTELMFSALTGGAADGRLLRLEWPLLQADDLSTGFAISHMVKDISLLKPLLTSAGLSATVVAAIADQFRATGEALGAQSATQALARHLIDTAHPTSTRKDLP